MIRWLLLLLLFLLLFLAGCDTSTACGGGVWNLRSHPYASCKNGAASIQVVDGVPFAVCTCPAAVPDAGARPAEGP